MLNQSVNEGQKNVSLKFGRWTKILITAASGNNGTESSHDKKTYDVTGPEALTHAEMASKFSEASGKQV